jgi:uncharacterized protein (UPF0332 family)
MGSIKDYIQYRIDRSDEIFDDAKLLAKNNRWRSCVNRLYYSSFHLVDALMTLNNITTKTHEGLKTKFFQVYIKSGKFDKDFGKLYAKLIDWRQESDYSVFVDFEGNDILPLIDKVDKFNNLLLKSIKEKL